MSQQVSDHVHSQMQRCTFPPADTMVTVGVGHVIKRFAQFDEAIHQSFHDLEMGIGLARAVNDQQVSLEAIGKVDGSRFAVAFWAAYSCCLFSLCARQGALA